jgi:hypothetical protein
MVGLHVPDISDSARLFALAELAMGDAGITAWDSKFHFVFWRPLTAIQEGDNDGNPETAGDPNWQPMINTPNYPDYTSGANNVTGAITRVLALFFGTDEMTFTVTTTNATAPQQTRTYNRFSDAAEDVVKVRIYQGSTFALRTCRRGSRGAMWPSGSSLTSCARSTTTITTITMTRSDRGERLPSSRIDDRNFG